MSPPSRTASPIELDDHDATEPSQSLIDHRQPLPATSHKTAYPKDSSNEVQQQSGWILRWHALPWKFEILSWVASLYFFIGIIVALVVFNGRSIPDLPLGINPNAIIQVLATFGEFFLMIPVTSAIGQMKWLRALQVRPVYEFRTMDEASRGPWGSFLLIMRRTGGLIASFGALITIIGLGTSTFVQQALKYDTVYLSTNDAFVPIAKTLNWSELGGYTGTDGVTVTIDTNVQSATYIGLFSPLGTKFLVDARCNSGNCTWESYRTLAVCNTCANLTSLLNITNEQLDTNDSKLAYHTDYYRLPNGFILNGRQQDSVAGRFPKAILNITNTLQAIEMEPNGTKKLTPSIAFANNGSALLSVFAIGPSPGKIPAEPDATNMSFPLLGQSFGSPVAFECLLQFCVQELRAEFRNGTLEETVVSVYINKTQSSPTMAGPHDYTDVIFPEVFLQPPATGDTFGAFSDAVEAADDWLRTFFTGYATIYTDNHFINPSEMIFSQPTAMPLFRAMNQSSTGFPDLMDSIASSISRNIRTISSQPSSPNGLSFYPTTRATVVWGWMALPFFLLIASQVFLIIVVLETERRGLVPWTNNILAALFHGIDERSSGHTVRETEHVMEEEAKTLLVEFQPRDDGGRLAVARRRIKG